MEKTKTTKTNTTTKKEKHLINMITEWFEYRTMLSKADFEMLKRFYWEINIRG